MKRWKDEFGCSAFVSNNKAHNLEETRRRMKAAHCIKTDYRIKTIAKTLTYDLKR